MQNLQEFQTRYVPNPNRLLELCYYQALSVAAVNPDAYLLTKKGIDWSPAQIWARVEYAALTQNQNIQRVWRVDPRPPEVKGVTEEENCELEKKELLWERGRDEELKNDFVCPVL